MPRPEDDYQQIRAKGMFPTTLDLDPPQTLKLWVNNILQRTLATLTGWTGKKSVLLRATSAGALKVADTGSGFESYDVATGNAPDAFNIANQLESTERPSRWDLYVEDNDAIIRFRNREDTGWLDEVYLPVGTYSIDFTSKTVQIRNRIAGQVCKYQLVGYW